MKLNIWLIIRVTLVGWTFIGSFLTREPVGPAMSRTQAFIYFLIGFLFFWLFSWFWLWVAAANEKSSSVWTYPAWSDTLLDLEQPARLLHASAWVATATAVSGFITHALWDVQNLWQIAGGSGMALGLWLSIYLSWSVFRWRREPIAHRRTPTRRPTSG